METHPVNQDEVWTKIWQRNFSYKENQFACESEQKSTRWHKVKDFILKRYGSFAELEIIEIGAGRGTYALLASLEGAHVTLLDNNPVAFDKAKEFFVQWGKNFNSICADAFHLPEELLGQFDVVMSYGFAEHFRYPERLGVFESHLKLLKPGGLLIVSVPNRVFLPYRIGKLFLECLNRWAFGLEIPFSRKELGQIAVRLGLQNWRVMGSGLIGDTLNFWLIQRLLHLPRYLWERFLSFVRWNAQGNVARLKDRFFYFPYHPKTWLDDYFGYALILAGEKPQDKSRYWMNSEQIRSFRGVVYGALLFLFRIKEWIGSLGQPAASQFPVQATDYPSGLGVEVTNLCNANCVFCGYQYRERPVMFMSQETFSKVIDDYVAMGGGAGGIGLTPVVGDPLIDRGLPEKIRYARSISQIQEIHLTTNGILLTKELFNALVAAGLSSMTISMSGFDPLEYERIYRNNAYEKVMANLRAIAASSCFQKCKVEIGLRTDRLFPWFQREYWELTAAGFKITRNLFFDNWSGRIRQEDLSGFMFLRPERNSKRIPCRMLYASPQVLADGRVTACGCRDLEGTSELALGSIQKHSLAEVLSDEKLEQLRQRFIEGDLPDICRDCKFYAPAQIKTRPVFSEASRMLEKVS